MQIVGCNASFEQAVGTHVSALPVSKRISQCLIHTTLALMRPTWAEFSLVFRLDLTHYVLKL
jgi:hypothetical protein